MVPQQRDETTRADGIAHGVRGRILHLRIPHAVVLPRRRRRRRRSQGRAADPRGALRADRHGVLRVGRVGKSPASSFERCHLGRGVGAVGERIFGRVGARRVRGGRTGIGVGGGSAQCQIPQPPDAHPLQHPHPRSPDIIHRRPLRLRLPRRRRPPTTQRRLPIPLPGLARLLRRRRRRPPLPSPDGPRRPPQDRRRDPQARDRRHPLPRLRRSRPRQPRGLQHVRPRRPAPPPQRVRQHGLLRLRGPRKLLRIPGFQRQEPGRAPPHTAQQQSEVHEFTHFATAVAATQSDTRVARQGL
mmetsp:Transcript_17724/g.38661  ORF Transcript_17724/g.38661 Transcript_17724/m.38661 type:complete len:300 (+) Transcript_17724:293-1192(+)